MGNVCSERSPRECRTARSQSSELPLPAAAGLAPATPPRSTPRRATSSALWTRAAGRRLLHSQRRRHCPPVSTSGGTSLRRGFVSAPCQFIDNEKGERMARSDQLRREITSLETKVAGLQKDQTKAQKATDDAAATARKKRDEADQAQHASECRRARTARTRPCGRSSASEGAEPAARSGPGG